MSRKAQPRGPGLNDVARVAGVSHQTVSRVINNHPNVSEATRERVQAAITQLGYRRNHAARALVTNRSGLLGVITVGSSLYGPTSALIAIEEAAREHGYQVLISSLRHGDPTGFASAIDSTLDHGVEALMVIASHEALIHLTEQLNVRVPVFLVGCQPEYSTHVNGISVDQFAGGRLAAEHLIELGHTEVLHITGPPEWPDARERLRAWQATCDEHGIDGGRLRFGDWSSESGYDIGQALLKQKNLPTGIFVANDNMSLGLLRAFQEGGLRVPDDVSIVGFDDIPGADNFLPPLTTVRQDFETLGHRVLRAVVAVIEGETPNLTPVPASLVVRNTTAPPRAN